MNVKIEYGYEFPEMALSVKHIFQGNKNVKHGMHIIAHCSIL